MYRWVDDDPEGLCRLFCGALLEADKVILLTFNRSVGGVYSLDERGGPVSCVPWKGSRFVSR
jgi:hypothetical protein